MHYTLGVTLWQQGDFPAAAEELRATIRVKPDYAEAYYTLGTVLKQQGKLEDAADVRCAKQFACSLISPERTRRWPRSCASSATTQGAAAEAKAGVEIGKQKTNQQAALFATNSGRRLLNAGDLGRRDLAISLGDQRDAGLRAGALSVGIGVAAKGRKGRSNEGISEGCGTRPASDCSTVTPAVLLARIQIQSASCYYAGRPIPSRRAPRASLSRESPPQTA